jgi:hypothetical protein
VIGRLLAMKVRLRRPGALMTTSALLTASPRAARINGLSDRLIATPSGWYIMAGSRSPPPPNLVESASPCDSMKARLFTTM